MRCAWSQRRLSFSWFKGCKRSTQAPVPCSYSTLVHQQQVDDVVEYPPVKPKFPPGKWGYMSPKLAWQWQDEIDSISKIDSVKERIDKLCNIEARPIWAVKPLSPNPGALDFQLYLTKTHLIKGLPEIYQTINVEDELTAVTNIVKDHILLEESALNRDKCFSKLRGSSASWNLPSLHTQYFIGQLLQSLVGYLSSQSDHLLSCQYDESVRVAAYWYRHGIARKGKELLGHPRPENSPFHVDHLADCQIRINKPLKPFLSRDEGVCIEGDYPQCSYHPKVMGLISDFVQPAVVAGHWSEDQCNFGLLSAHATNITDQWEKRLSPDLIRDIQTGCGVVSSFACQVAQAHYQGFNMYCDITSPFCGQSILTDGKTFTFYAYQLNTLQLWKDDDSNSYRNICWQSEDIDLYESVENGEVKGFNEDVLRTILRFVMNSPRTDLDLNPGVVKSRDVMSHPYISDKPPPVLEEQEQPLYVE